MAEAEINFQHPVQHEVLMEEATENQHVIEPPTQLSPDQQTNYLPLEITEDEQPPQVHMALEVDLNMLALEVAGDPEVIVNPIQASAFLKLNVVATELAVEKIRLPHIVAPVQHLPKPLVEEQNLMQLVDELQQNRDFILQQPLAQDDLLTNKLMDEEIPLDQLVGYEHEEPPVDQIILEEQIGEDDQQLQVQQPIHQNLNVGMGLVQAPMVDTIFMAWERNRAAQAFMCWEGLCQKGNLDGFSVNISVGWANFFTMLLMSPDSFAWTRELLASRAATFLDSKCGSLIFFIPNKCPSEKKIACITEIIDPEGTQGVEKNAGQEAAIQQNEKEESCTPTARRKRAKKTTPLSENDVRRSSRLKQLNNGFKPSSGGCKSCFACLPSPPTLSSKVIKNLGVQFCKMNLEDLSDEALCKKKQKPEPIKKGGDKMAEEMDALKDGRTNKESVDVEDGGHKAYEPKVFGGSNNFSRSLFSMNSNLSKT